MSKLDKNVQITSTCPNWFKNVQIASNMSILFQTCAIWLKLVPNVSNLVKNDQIIVSWSKLAKTCLNLTKFSQTCQNQLSYVQISLNLFKLFQTRPNLCTFLFFKILCCFSLFEMIQKFIFSCREAWTKKLFFSLYKKENKNNAVYYEILALLSH